MCVDVGNSLNTANCTVTGLPLIKDISPSIGSLNGGTILTISGNGFVSDSTTVLVGSSVCFVTHVTLDQVTCITSAHAVGTVSFAIKLVFSILLQKL